MITAAELLLLCNASDHLAQIGALVLLLNRGLVAAVTEGDAITAIRTSSAGDSALRVVTMHE